MDTSETIILCHQAYCEAAGIEPDALRLNVVFQRWWFDMISEYQIEPNDVKLIVKGRLRANRGRSDASFHSSIQLSRMIRRDDTRAVIYEELLTIKSAMRKRSIDPARAAALRATGRSDQPTPQNIIPIKTQTANALEQVASELRKNA